MEIVALTLVLLGIVGLVLGLLVRKLRWVAVAGGTLLIVLVVLSVVLMYVGTKVFP